MKLPSIVKGNASAYTRWLFSSITDSQKLLSLGFLAVWLWGLRWNTSYWSLYPS